MHPSCWHKTEMHSRSPGSSNWQNGLAVTLYQPQWYDQRFDAFQPFQNSVWPMSWSFIFTSFAQYLAKHSSCFTRMSLQHLFLFHTDAAQKKLLLAHSCVCTWAVLFLVQLSLRLDFCYKYICSPDDQKCRLCQCRHTNDIMDQNSWCLFAFAMVEQYVMNVA